MGLISPVVASGGIAPVAVQVRTGGMDLLAGGTVVTADSKGFDVSIGPLRFDFEFVIESEPGLRIRTQTDGAKLTVSLVNFDGLGGGTSVPLVVGTWQGRKLHLMFSVYSTVASAPKTVHFSFLLGDAV